MYALAALAVAFLQQGGTSTTWRRCKACIAFCVQRSLVLFQYLQCFAVGRWMGLCSPRGRELFLVRSLQWCSPRTAPSKVSQTDGFLTVFGTVFKLIFYFLNLLSRFLLTSVSKAWEPADVLTPPRSGRLASPRTSPYGGHWQADKRTAHILQTAYSTNERN